MRSFYEKRENKETGEVIKVFTCPQELKERVSRIVSMAGILFAQYSNENLWDSYDEQSFVAYFIMYQCLTPSYWIDANFEIVDNKIYMALLKIKLLSCL